MKKGGTVDVLNPGIVFLILYLIYNFIAFIDDIALRQPGAAQYATLSAIGLAGITVGTVLAHYRRHVRGMPSARSIPLPELQVVSAVAVVLCVVLLLLMYARSGGISAILAEKAITRQLARSGVLSGAFYLLPVSLGLMMYSSIVLRNRISILLCLASLALLLVIFRVFSSRGELMMSAVFVVFLIHYNIKRIPWWLATAAFSVLFLVMVILGILRAGHGTGSEGMFSQLNTDRIRNQLHIEKLEPYQAMVRGMEILSDGHPRDGNLLLGSGYLFALEQVLPQAVLPWPRHQAIASWYLETYDPERARAGGGWNFPPLLEAYMNFKWVGCLVVPMIIAYFVQRLHIRAGFASRHTTIVLIDCMVATTLCQIHRHPFDAYFKNSLYIFCLSGFLIITVSQMLHRRKVRQNLSGAALKHV